MRGLGCDGGGDYKNEVLRGLLNCGRAVNRRNTVILNYILY